MDGGLNRFVGTKSSSCLVETEVLSEISVPFYFNPLGIKKPKSDFRTPLETSQKVLKILECRIFAQTHREQHFNQVNNRILVNNFAIVVVVVTANVS